MVNFSSDVDVTITNYVKYLREVKAIQKQINDLDEQRDALISAQDDLEDNLERVKELAEDELLKLNSYVDEDDTK